MTHIDQLIEFLKNKKQIEENSLNTALDNIKKKYDKRKTKAEAKIIKEQQSYKTRLLRSKIEIDKILQQYPELIDMKPIYKLGDGSMKSPSLLSIKNLNANVSVNGNYWSVYITSGTVEVFQTWRNIAINSNYDNSFGYLGYQSSKNGSGWVSVIDVIDKTPFEKNPQILDKITTQIAKYYYNNSNNRNYNQVIIKDEEVNQKIAKLNGGMSL